MDSQCASLEVSALILPTDKERTKFIVTVEISPEKIFAVKITWPLLVARFESIIKTRIALSEHGIFSDIDPRIALAIIECIEELEKSAATKTLRKEEQ